MSAAQPDAWPAAASYRYLDDAGAADLAWEWLRRDPDYRKIAAKSASPAHDTAILDPASAQCTARWGCLNMPDAERRCTDAPLLWSAEIDRSVLRVLALPTSGRLGTPFDLAACGTKAFVVNAGECQHVLLGGRAGSIRLDVLSGSLLDGPVSLVLALAGMEEDGPAMVTLRRFLQLRCTGRIPALSTRGCQRLQRQVLALRVHDALAAGASIRDVGVMLFGFERVRDEWADEALKSHCRRLITLVREMVAGGYRTLLA